MLYETTWPVVGIVAVLGMFLFVLWRAYFRWRLPDCTLRKEAKMLGTAVIYLVGGVITVLVSAKIYDEIDLRVGDAG